MEKKPKVVSLDDVRKIKENFSECSGCGEVFEVTQLRFSPKMEEYIRRLTKGEDASDMDVSEEEAHELFCPDCWNERFGG